jgi:leucyl aminopeptidase (aminopeptidase T)
MLTQSIRELFHTNLGVKKTEKVLVFSDRPTKRDAVAEGDLLRWQKLRDVVMLVAETGRSFTEDCIYVSFPSRGGHGVEPPEVLWKSAFGEKTVGLLKERKLFRSIIQKRVTSEKNEEIERILNRHKRSAVDVVIALSNYSTSHTRFRDFLTRLCGARYASMPLFEVEMFEGAMDVDWKSLEKRTKRIAKLVNRAREVSLTTPNGTELTVSKAGRKAYADTGNLRQPGSFGNLPAGEVFFAPVEGTAQGRLVLEWGPTRRLSSRVTLVVKAGVVEKVEGDEEFADWLRGILSEKKENTNIAEFGIGTNEKAWRPDNILESEKILGTVHVALGDNSSFGGRIKTPFHQDSVFFHPTVMLKDRDDREEVLIKDGEMILQGVF